MLRQWVFAMMTTMTRSGLHACGGIKTWKSHSLGGGHWLIRGKDPNFWRQYLSVGRYQVQVKRKAILVRGFVNPSRERGLRPEGEEDKQMQDRIGEADHVPHDDDEEIKRTS